MNERKRYGLAMLVRRITLPLMMVAIVSGCHTLRFDVAPGPRGSVVKERKSFFFWGLAPTKRVDMGEKCPTGVATITEETNFVDGLCDLVTLGIWTPRSTYYSCRSAEGGE